jgi:7-cyano-7-deazaguanine synthase
MSASAIHPDQDARSTAVLTSGGLDSVVLLAAEAQRHTVQPIYVSCGLAWEPVERESLTRFLAAYRAPRPILPLATLEFLLSDIYPKQHWAIRGAPPEYNAPDNEVYLIGRNITLLAKAGIFCATAGIGRIAMGQLQGNPFPDATPAFFSAMAHALSLGLDHDLDVSFPFLAMKKAAVIQLGVSLGVPLELTISCMNPQGSKHCGACNKCRERKDAFAASGVEDRTVYDTRRPTSV